MNMRVILAAGLLTLQALPVFAQEDVNEKLSLDNLATVIVASRNCGADTKISPELAGAYVYRYAKQEELSYEKALYIATSKGDELYSQLIRSGKKAGFCLRFID